MKNTTFKVSIATFFYLGIAVGAQKKSDTTTKEKKIDEVVVVGYGKTTKQKLTDNIVKIDASAIKDIPTANFQNALVGKAAGVRIDQVNGKLESGFSINVRGAASISASTSPLYVIDGVPMINNDESTNGAPVNPLVSLSATEIESIEILKDASSAAIYGARGSNGVVLITTKTGKKGKPRLSFNMSHGISRPTRFMTFLNAKQYVELMLESARNSSWTDESYAVKRLNRYSNNTDWRNGVIDTDWQRLALRTGTISDADFTISGAEDKYNYMFTASHNATEGIVLGNDLERNTARINVSATPVNKLKLGLNLAYSRTNISRVANDNQFTTPMQAIAQAPISPAYVNGEPFAGTLYPNFLLEEKYSHYTTLIRRVTSKIFGEYKILENLSFNSDLGYDNYNQSEVVYRGRKAPQMSTDGYAFNSFVDTESIVFSNYLTYRFRAAQHHFEIVGGTELTKATRSYSSVTGIKFPSDDFQTIDSAGEIIGGEGNKSSYAFFSYFARLNYDFEGKYLFKASVRRDGSSRFGADNQYAVFPAFSAGWIISKENFLVDSNLISFLKIRGSWGKTGNAEVGDDAAKDLWTGTKYNNLSAITNSQPPNQKLSWEKATQVDVGIDFGFFNNKVTGELDYYDKKSSGLLFFRNLPYTTGYSNIYSNYGDMDNKGFEVVINTKNFQRENFSWTSSFNIANNENRITALPDNNADIIVGNVIRRVGERLNSFYLVEYAGVDPANGDALYYKNTLKPDGTLDKSTTNDYSVAKPIIAGSSTPTWIGGFTNTLQFINFDFGFTFYGEFGASIYNSAGKFQSTNGDWFDNQTADQMNRWQNPGDITDVPQARLDDANGNQESTRYLHKANFVRLRNVSLGYTFNDQLTQSLGMTKLRIYITAINPVLFTNFNRNYGYDPESRADTNRGGGGATFYSAPPAKSFTFGINVNF